MINIKSKLSLTLLLVISNFRVFSHENNSANVAHVHESGGNNYAITLSLVILFAFILCVVFEIRNGGETSRK